MMNGYFTAGCGKVFHLSGGATEEGCSWHEFSPFYRPASQLRQNPPLSGVAGLAARDTLDWGVIDDPEEEYADWKIADWAIAQLAQLCREPIETFAEIFDFLGVRYRNRTRHWLKGNVYTSRMGKWRELPADELAKPLEIGRPLLTELGYL
jgi:hypothetical protein